MKRNTTIALFYTGVAAICIGVISISMYLSKGLNAPYQAPAVDMGKETAPQWFPIAKDLSATNQDNKPVKLSDLRGKVWVVAEFFAICPHCAVRNGEELRKIYDEFKSHPDFHITCISVDPENDNPERLAEYSSALGADSKNWWFLNAGDAASTHDYLEHELKFFGIRQRTDPLDIEANGKYAHDLGFIVVDRDFKVIGKWPLADARSEDAKKRDPELYQKLKDELYARIRAELEKNETPGI
ncbi:MAG: SCO family protein [Luteolibacter sp.]|uniref:SCO family protein n=1 Tax=Luteolibacter sp. TaxID=1962973 RepID=UPI003264EA8C